MVNPGAFHGAQKEFMLSQKLIYNKAINNGYTDEAVADIQCCYFKRFSVDLPDDQEPTANELAAIDDDAVDPEQKKPDPETLSAEELSMAMEILEKRQKTLEFQKAIHYTFAIILPVAREMFSNLPEEQQIMWKSQAIKESKEAETAWKNELDGQASTTPEDCQRAILGLVQFAQPLLDLICEATGWKVSLIAGGPEPANKGHLNVISVHSGTTMGDYQKDLLPVFGSFLKKCYSTEECHAWALTSGLRSLDCGDLEKNNATLDSIDHLLPTLTTCSSGETSGTNTSLIVQHSPELGLSSTESLLKCPECLPQISEANMSSASGPSAGPIITSTNSPDCSSGQVDTHQPSFQGASDAESTPPSPPPSPPASPSISEDSTITTASMPSVKKQKRLCTIVIPDNDETPPPEKQQRIKGPMANASPPHQTSLHNNPVDSSPITPEWFMNTLSMIQGRGIASNPHWMELVHTWARFEVLEGYMEKSRLSSSSQPTAVTTYEPPIHIRKYAKEFKNWWTILQPEWQTSDSAILLKECDSDWESLRKPGQNGIISIIVGLFYWGAAVKEVLDVEEKWKGKNVKKLRDA
ncbi:hypothetical protein CPB84DRAFT_1851182 [Gymnopilus junonius]|uniref:Uncharacterized protein n=1 Tax=Gymnopilus junonius TaxID=109634 RepID=A0A9P5NEZ1_GYMJU|nr:hypothetical protein CPB84DRAFT_1851182 [Gymnopilus junonius]